MAEKNNTLAYVPAFDGLRGVAVLAVIIFHAGALFPGLHYLQGGYIGVDLFFVLSGFLITSLIIREYDETASLNLKYFYMRRLLRLGPALLLLLITYSLLSLLMLSDAKAWSNLVDAFIALIYMSNWARAFFIHAPDYLGHTWSLSMEEQFYILWPIILLLLLRTINNRWMIAGVVFIVAVLAWGLRIYMFQDGVSVHRLYNGLDTRADALMVGCALGVIVSSGLLDHAKRECLSKSLLTFFSPLAAVALTLIAIYMGWKDSRMYYWGFFTVEICAAILILDVLINRKSWIRPILSLKWIVWVGSLSYGLYLWHFPVFRLVQSVGYGGMKSVVCGLVLSFMVSVGSFYLLEQPMLKYKRKYRYENGDRHGQ